MQVVLISDTHGMHGILNLPLPEGDIIIHSGDLGENMTDTRNFLHWFDSLPHKYKIFIAGNHDKFIERRLEDFYHYYDYYRRRKKEGEGQITFLFDQMVEFEGVKIYGSPWTRNLPNWAFQVADDQAAKCWSKVPDDIDILVTHGPAYGIGDAVSPQYLRGREDPHVGCKALLARVKEVKPKIHVFGHIHEGAGVHCDIEGVKSVNASVLDENYHFYRKDPKTVADPYVITI